MYQMINEVMMMKTKDIGQTDTKDLHMLCVIIIQTMCTVLHRVNTYTMQRERDTVSMWWAIVLPYVLSFSINWW